ncbi:MAG: energy-coupling factor transporter ATPase [Lachnospiraceae bacterium]|nr:energy-coupling factor transporter ATPase [Lachnospiraceae bacterium]
MSFIKSEKLKFEYIRRDENGNVDSINKAIDEVDLDIEKGQFIAILGSNGSGKSTLAKHINALLTPADGTMWINGNDTKDAEKLKNIRQSVGMVFQNPDNQIIGSIVEEDVGFGPENIGVPTKEIWNRVDDALEKVDMNDFRLKSPNKLSGGQKQRVAIAGVLAMKPQCIVLDEPTAMLDPQGRRDVIDTITKLNKTDNITIILVTHYMEEVVNADRVIVLNKGKIVMQDTPRGIFSQIEKLESFNLDVPEVTKVANMLSKSGLEISDGILTVEELADEIMAAKKVRIC